MKDIAKDLNVSVATVSKVLRGHIDISPEMRERVLRRVQDLNYRPNLAARALVTGRTYLIGLVVPDLLHPFFAQIAQGVANRIRTKGYNAVIFSSGEEPSLEIEGIASLLAHQVDGLILASTLTKDQSDVFRRIEKQNVPYVLVDRKVPGVRANFVGVNDEEIGALATDHLVQRGSHRIAHICGPQISTAIGRLRGYMKTMARHRLPVPPQYVANAARPDVKGEEGGFQAMQQLLTVDPRPDAVFCYNDLVAIGALRAILNAGLRVPADVALIGVSNSAHTDLLKVSLSTIDQGSLLIGDRAAKLLLKHMEAAPGSPPTRIYLRSKLIVRDSSVFDPGSDKRLHQIGVAPADRAALTHSVPVDDHKTRSHLQAEHGSDEASQGFGT
jgi:LacI family transcriptional regulator